jgi:hypothetical protein
MHVCEGQCRAALQRHSPQAVGRVCCTLKFVLNPVGQGTVHAGRDSVRQMRAWVSCQRFTGGLVVGRDPYKHGQHMLCADALGARNLTASPLLLQSRSVLIKSTLDCTRLVVH